MNTLDGLSFFCIFLIKQKNKRSNTILTKDIKFAVSAYLPFSIEPQISDVTEGWKVALNSKFKQVKKIIVFSPKLKCLLIV